MNRDTSIFQTVSVTNVTHSAVTTGSQYSTNQRTGNSTNNSHLYRAKRRGKKPESEPRSSRGHTVVGSQLDLDATLLS